MSLDFLTLPDPELRQETRHFTDPKQPGAVATFTFKEPDGFAALLASDLGTQWAAQFGDTGIPLRDGSCHPADATVCGTAALLHILDMEHRALDEWLLFAKKMPGAFVAVVRWAGELVQQGQCVEGNSAGVSAAP